MVSFSGFGRTTEFPHCLQFCLSKSEYSMGLPALRGRLLRNGRTSARTHRSISIVAEGRGDVCDGAHGMFVMKNVEVRLRSSVKNPKQWAGVESHPFKKRREGKPGNCLVLIGVYPGLCNFGNASIFASPTIRRVTGRFWGCECYRDVTPTTDKPESFAYAFDCHPGARRALVNSEQYSVWHLR